MANYVQLQSDVTRWTHSYLTAERVFQMMDEEQIQRLDSVETVNRITNRCIEELRPLIDEQLINKKVSFTSRNFIVHLLDIVPRKLREIVIS